MWEQTGDAGSDRLHFHEDTKEVVAGDTSPYTDTTVVHINIYC